MIGRAYSNNGLNYRTSPGSDLLPGEVFFGLDPSPSDLASAFPGYNAAVAAQQAAASANAQYAAAIAAGLTVNWTTSTSLNATYMVDQSAQNYISAENISILTNSTFTNGQTTRVWPDKSGAYHTFSIAQFKAFATQVALYVDQLILAMQTAAAGQQATWPAATTTINL